jgi:hypothetical protein
LALQPKRFPSKKHIKPKIEEIENQRSKVVKQYINIQPCKKQENVSPPDDSHSYSMAHIL